MKDKVPADKLRWYEIICCCCKCRRECKLCVATIFVYYIPIILLLAIATGCIVVGVLFRTQCPYNDQLPYWVMASSISPLLLLPFIKAVKEDYYGVTSCRLLSIILYLLFLSITITGSVLSYDTWTKATSDSCNIYLQWFAFVLTFVHWLLFLLVTIALIYMLTKMCCCCTENTVQPLKSGNLREYNQASLLF